MRFISASVVQCVACQPEPDECIGSCVCVPPVSYFADWTSVSAKYDTGGTLLGGCCESLPIFQCKKNSRNGNTVKLLMLLY